MKLLFIVNASAFFLSHRLPLALAAREAGYEVHVACPESDSAEIKGIGFVYHCLPISRSGTKPWKELYSLWELWRLFRRLQPNLLHLVTIKPVLYGGLMARMAGLPAVLIEVLGCSKIIISSDCPSGPREILENGKWGALFDVGDHIQLARLLKSEFDDYICKDFAIGWTRFTPKLLRLSI